MTQPVPPPLSAAGPAGSTKVRFLVLAICIGMALLLYLDRFALSPASDTILTELKLSKAAFGEAVKSFFLAYALMQIPAGWLTDTLGARRTLTVYVIGWSLATMSLGLVDGIADISRARMLMGILQAGAYPAAAGLLKHWIPFRSRGTANSSVAMGGRLGGLIAFALTEPLMLVVGQVTGWETGRWQIVFMLFGSLGLVWAALFLWLFRDRPGEHPWCNAAERDLIAGPARDRPPPAPKPAAVLGPICLGYFLANVGWIVVVSRLPGLLMERQGPALVAWCQGEDRAKGAAELLAMVAGLAGTLALGALTNRIMRVVAGEAGRRFELPLAAMGVSKEVWLMCAINFCVNIGWIFLVTWLPQYLIDTHGDYVKQHIGDKRVVAGLLTAVIGLAGMVGSFSGGLATDQLVARFGRAWGRRLPGMTAGIVVSCLYLLAPRLESVWLFVGAMIVTSLIIDFGLGASWASYQDIGGRHVASVLGVGNMCGNLGAALFGLWIGILADENRWHDVFYQSAAAMAILAVCWLLFDASRVVVREEKAG